MVHCRLPMGRRVGGNGMTGGPLGSAQVFQAFNQINPRRANDDCGGWNAAQQILVQRFIPRLDGEDRRVPPQPVQLPNERHGAVGPASVNRGECVGNAEPVSAGRGRMVTAKVQGMLGLPKLESAQIGAHPVLVAFAVDPALPSADKIAGQIGK